MQEDNQLIGGSCWRMLRRDEEMDNSKVIGLVEAVERYGRKRSYGGEDTMMEGVETTTEFEANTPPPRKRPRPAVVPPISTMNAAAPPSPLGACAGTSTK